MAGLDSKLILDSLTVREEAKRAVTRRTSKATAARVSFEYVAFSLDHRLCRREDQLTLTLKCKIKFLPRIEGWHDISLLHANYDEGVETRISLLLLHNRKQ